MAAATLPTQSRAVHPAGHPAVTASTTAPLAGTATAPLTGFASATAPLVGSATVPMTSSASTTMPLARPETRIRFVIRPPARPVVRPPARPVVRPPARPVVKLTVRHLAMGPTAALEHSTLGSG